MTEDINAQYQKLWDRLRDQPKANLVLILKFLVGAYETKQDAEFQRLCSRAADAYLKAKEG